MGKELWQLLGNNDERDATKVFSFGNFDKVPKLNEPG